VLGALFNKNPGLADVYHEAQREWSELQRTGGADV
jgi:hypothetical protein